MSVASPRLWDAPKLQPLLPLIYVAWADGDLTDVEVREIQSAAQAQTFLDPDARSQLETWLDPQAPPSPLELRQLLRLIRNAADDLDAEQRKDLASLGVALANHDRHESDPQWINPHTAEGLRRAIEALGIDPAEAARELLPVPPTAIPAPRRDPARFDVAQLAALLDGELPDFRRQIRLMLRDSSRFTYHYDWDKTAHREQVKDWLVFLADQGYGRMAFPETLGEVEDLRQFIATFETLAFFDLSLVVKFGVQFGLFGGAIYFLGDDAQRERYLDDVAACRLLGCFAMTEHGHGSNVRGLETTASYDPETETFCIHSPNPRSGKQWIGNAACHARMAAVFAQLETQGESFGVHAFLVPIRDEEGRVLDGVRIEDSGHKMGLNGVDNGQIWFDHVTVPRDALLARYAQVSEDGTYHSPIPGDSRRFFTMLAALVGGRVSVGCAAVSAAKSGLAIAIHYSAHRRQFGRAGEHEMVILDYPTHQRRLMPLLARTYALNFALHDLVDVYVNKTEENAREVEAMAAGLKALATWHATEALQTARECCGGNGYLSVNRLPSLKADTDVFATFEGDNTVLLQLVAKSLLTAFKKRFSDNRTFAMLRYIASQAATAITELNPVTTRLTDVDHLRDPEFLHAALSYREESLLGSAVRRMQARVKSGMDGYDAFLEVQNHLVALALAHVERITLESFSRALERNTDPGAAEVLRALRDLYALDCIQRDVGWFLESGYVEPPKVRAIRRLHDALCADVRSQAVPLVDAFAIPDEVLSAPIATTTRGW